MNSLEERVLRIVGEDTVLPDALGDVDGALDARTWDYGYVHDWEADELTGETSQVFLPWDVENLSVSQTWETTPGQSISLNTDDRTTTQPWEEITAQPETESGLQLVRDSLNDAIQEICMVTGGYKRVYHLVLQASEPFYRMSWERDHFGWVMEAWDRNRKWKLTQTDLLTLAMTDPYWLKHSGPPEQYFQLGTDVVGVVYTPSTSGDVLELTCVVIPQAYTTDTDRIRLRTAWEDAAVYFAVSEFYASRGDAGRATEWHKKYMESAGIAVQYPELGVGETRFRPWRSAKEVNANG